MANEAKIILFQEKKIRRVWHNDEWWFSVVDVVEALTDSTDPKQYIKKMRSRDASLDTNWGTICTPLKMPTPDGKMRAVNAASTEGLFRLIMSVPSPKAEPFKLWLAHVGKERMDEIENPELAAERARALYRAKGYSEGWIEMRLKSIEVRAQLTEEWKNRGVQENQEYAILTAEISKATFGLTPSEYKQVKGIKRENLRDHMTNLELIFSMLSEETTRDEAVTTDAQGFVENRSAAIKAGRSVGQTLETYEENTGRKVVSEANFLGQIAAAKQKKLPEAKDE